MNDLSNYLDGVNLSSLLGPQNTTVQESSQVIDNTNAVALSAALSQSISQDWSIPYSTRPLNQSEVQFLRSHNVVEIGGRAETTSTDLDQFVQKVVQQAVTQLASDFTKIVVQDALKPNQAPVKTSTSHHKDPSIETMKKIAKHDVEARVISVGKKLLVDSIDVVQHGEFVNFAGKTLGATLETTKFLEKVQEIGFNAAAAETAGKVTSDFLLKHGVEATTSLVGCTNPVFCAKLIVSVIKGLFTPTETASAHEDMYGHIRLPFEFPKSSFIPELNPNAGQPGFWPAPN